MSTNFIELKKEEAAFYFNQALMNLAGLHQIIESQQQQLERKDVEKKDKAIDTIIENCDCLKKLELYIFYNKDVTKDTKGEIKHLLSKLIELRHFYSHYVHNNNVKILSKGEKPILERYYQIAIEKTGSENVKLEILEDDDNLVLVQRELDKSTLLLRDFSCL
ncbi:MAG: hypothetical protein JW837_14595 [Sedimentisphaerales bacterium]|nr:hypothetical protein [Sedimentisphaerales bacterium]